MHISEIKNKVGQMLMIGFEELQVSDEVKKFIKDSNIGGAIYFSRNYESPAQIAELSNEIQDTRKHQHLPLFISIDHECGKITRLKKPFTLFPEPSNLGEVNSPKLSFEVGQVNARELSAVGINLNFAPVLDVNSNAQNPIIGNRAFSRNPDICASIGSAYVRGLQKGGVMGCAKHFPGHGETSTDSHKELPKISKTIEKLDQLELIPFKKVFKSKVDFCMTAHILNSQIDPDYPATLSHTTIQEVLRSHCRFSKVIITDDMEMNAISDNYDDIEAAELAVNAGVDILLYCHSFERQQKIVEHLVRKFESGSLDINLLEESNKRILSLKTHYLSNFKPVYIPAISEFVGTDENKKIAQFVQNKKVIA